MYRYSRYKGYMGEADYVLPYGRGYAKWNPMHPTEHCFGEAYMADSSAIIVKRIDVPRKSAATRVIVTYGNIPDDWKIGAVWSVRHDQTNAMLGVYEVVGEVEYAEDENEEAVVVRAAGVTDMKLPVACFK
jgi:hypothetical protein